MIEFVGIHDGLNERIRQQHPFDHDRKSILSKGHGQVVRLAAVHWCMDQALARLSAVQAGNAPEEWKFEIPKETLVRAKTLLDYFIDEKLAIRRHVRSQNSSSNESDSNQYDWHRLRRIMELNQSVIPPFLITQKHITKKTADGRYTREDAIKLMLDLQTLEMGKVEQTQGPGRHTQIFRKRKLEDFNKQQLEVFTKQLKVDRDKYKA